MAEQKSTTNFLLLYLATISIVVIPVLSVPLCNICYEGQCCKIVYEVNTSSPEKMHFVWEKNSRKVSNCFSNGKATCLVFPHFKKKIAESKINVNESSLTLTLVLKNISRTLDDGLSMEGLWELSNLFENSKQVLQHSCILKIYKKLDDTVCKHSEKDEGMELECENAVSYPESKCNFTVSKDNGTMLSVYEPIYNSTKVSENPVYYRSRCSTIIPVQENLTGTFDYNILVFPNLDDANDSYVGAVRIMDSYSIEQPRVTLDNCNKKVVEGTRFNCACRKADNSDLTTQVIWYYKNTTIQSSVDVSLLSTVIYLNSTNYTCVAKSKFSLGNSIGYFPHVMDQHSLENTNVSCPDERSHICMPFRRCYGNHEFCNDGNVESCFPPRIEGDNLLSWCKSIGQFNDSLMRSSKCNNACASQFGRLLTKDDDREKNVSQPVCPKAKPNRCHKDCYGYKEYCLKGKVTPCNPDRSGTGQSCPRSQDTPNSDSNDCDDKKEDGNNSTYLIIGVIGVIFVIGLSIGIYFYWRKTKGNGHPALEENPIPLLQYNTKKH